MSSPVLCVSAPDGELDPPCPAPPGYFAVGDGCGSIAPAIQREAQREAQRRAMEARGGCF